MGSFLDEYAAWAGECTDAPSIYQSWGGYSALACAIGRRVCFQVGAERVFPNLYIGLLGPSSIFRKTTCVNLSRSIATVCGAHKLADEGSVEGFVKGLEQTPVGVLYYSELSSLLSQFQREYMLAMQPMLTDLYDSPYEWRRKLAGSEIVIERPCLNLLAGSTLEWLLDRAKIASFSGGFLARFCFVVATKKERTMALPPPIDEARRNALATHLRGLTGFLDHCKPPVHVSLEPIRKEYETWYGGFERRASSPILASFIARLAITCLKLAVLEEISDTGGCILSVDAFDRAATRVDELADAIAELEDTELGFGDGRDASDVKRVLRVIKADGESSRKRLLTATRIPAKRLSMALRALEDTDHIITRRVKPEGGGRPAELYSLAGKGCMS